MTAVLRERVAPPSDDRRPACLGREELFFPENGRSAESAQAICARCPVREWCMAWGMDEKWGVWGGVDRRKRTARKAS